MPTTTRKAYRVEVGLNYPPKGKGAERRAEPGDLVTDLPPAAIPGLLEQGSISDPASEGNP